MTVFRLPREVDFPDPRRAEPDGLLAVGGDLAPERLLAAYAAGIFPWYSAESPILWWSPDPRLVLEPSRLHVPRSLARTRRRAPFRFSADTAFEQVIRGCAGVDRPDQDGTWITPAMIDAYCQLHRRGFAHSFEAWEGEALVGGLYGVSLGAVFFGESMFTTRPDASKLALVESVEWLSARGIRLIDCQVWTEHLARFGAESWSRERFLAALAEGLERPTLRGAWTLTGP